MMMMILVGILWLSVEGQCKSLMFQPLDCADIYNDSSRTSGVYMMYPAGPNSGRYVYCDMQTDGGKWTVLQGFARQVFCHSDVNPETDFYFRLYFLRPRPLLEIDVDRMDIKRRMPVFQRRMDGTVNFYRGWDQYKNGFGHAAGEYWMGLETIHLLTLKKNYELRVDIEDSEGNTVYAKYKSFAISPMAINAELDGYKLKVSGFEDGGAGDSLSYHDGSKFSTFDKDQDSYEGNCAVNYFGAYWYNSCYDSNPNGLYTWGTESQQGTVWRKWKGFKSVKSISMKIRPVNLD